MLGQEQPFALDRFGVMDEGASLARPLGETSGAPIEWPEEVRTRRPKIGQWFGLAAFAVIGATTILIASGIGEGPERNAAALEPIATIGSAAPVVPKTLEAAPTRGDGYARLARPVVYAVPLDGAPAVGREDAVVTLVVAHDYLCAPCEQARDAIAGLRAKYGDDLRVVYKPYAGNSDNRPALEAACVAARHGAFDRFDDALWRAGVGRANSLGVRTVLPDDDKLDRIVRDLGIELPRAELERCAVFVRNSRRELDALHVVAPVYFVNGRLVEGKPAELPAVIDEELARAAERLRDGATRERYYREWVLDLGKTTR
jgi:protein-disulfide isomerase